MASLRVLEADLDDDPSLFLSNFEELGLTEDQGKKLVEVIRRVTKPLEQLIAEGRARKAAPQAAGPPPPPGALNGRTSSGGGADGRNDDTKPGAAPIKEKRVLVTASFGRSDRQDFKLYFRSRQATDASNVEALREEVRERIAKHVVGGLDACGDDSLVIDVKPGLSYRKMIGRLVEKLPLCEGSEEEEGGAFDVLVKYSPTIAVTA